MRNSLVLFAALLAMCFAATNSQGAIQEVGTLMLSGETVIFHTPVKDVTFDLMRVPGLHLVKYNPKTTTKGDQEIDASEAVFSDDGGHTFTLVQGKSQDVTRVMDGDKTIWKFSVKFRS